jgi:hypothetical protein
MTDERETDQPNEEGFAGDPTTPEPQPGERPIEESDAEAIAVPSGDLTHPIAETLEDLGNPDD